MHIKLDGDWVITCNSNNIILGKERTKVNKDTGEDEIYVTPVGYYCTPVSALKGYLKYGVRDSSVETLIELEEHYNGVLERLSSQLNVPVSQQRRIEELEQEVSTLNTRIKTLSKKAKGE
jgi:hypothetical protein